MFFLIFIKIDNARYKRGVIILIAFDYLHANQAYKTVKLA